MRLLFFVRLFLGLCLACLHIGCVTNGRERSSEAPKITSETPFAEAIDIALTYGGKSLAMVKESLNSPEKKKAAGKILHKRLTEDHKSFSPTMILNAVNLYQASEYYKAPQLFSNLARAERSITQQIAWHLAAMLPSAMMASALETVLTEAIAADQVSSLFHAKMAEAVASNKLRQSYSVVRQGLYESNQVEFARAMISLDPKQASRDFLDYLAKAPVSELRQLSVSSVDIFACIEILKHFQSYPPELAQPHFDHLFFYSISRNTALSEMAREVLQNYIGARSEYLALMLARLPNWVQIAFVEGSKRQLNPQLSMFLRELKHTTSQRDVIEEIDHVIR